MAESVLELKLIDRASPGLNKADANAKRLNKTVDSTSRKLQRGTANFFGFGKGASTAGNAAAGATPKIAAMGVALKTALGPIAILTGTVGALTGAVSTFAKQDFAEAKVESLGVNSKELTARLRTVSKELGGQADVVELTAAAYDVASAGFTDAADAAKVLKAASLGATGGFSDLNTVGDAATSVLNAYGLSADEANAVVDKFIQTQNDGKIVVAQYAQGIGKVASVAAMLKVPLKEVNAVIAQSTAAGVKSEVAFTGLKTALLRLGGERGGRKLAQWGIDISAATLESEGLLASLKKLQHLDTTGLESIFGQEAIQTMAPIMKNLEKYEELIRKQEQSAGAAAIAQAKAADTINGAWKELQTTITNAFADQGRLGQFLKVSIQLVNAVLKATVRLIEISAYAIEIVISRAAQAINAIVEFANKIPGINIELKKGIKEYADTAGKRLKEMREKLEGVEEAAEGAGKAVGEVINPPASGGGGGKKDPKDDPKEVGEAWKKVGNIIRNDVSGAIKGMLKGTQTLGEAALGILSKISDMFIDLAVQGMFTSLGSGGGWMGKFFGGKASGGPVMGGGAYLVGEKGPELFQPEQSGNIVSNNDLNSALARYSPSTGETGSGGGEEAGAAGGGGTGGSGQIDVRFNAEVINEVSYVTFAQFQEGVREAAKRGAREGEAGALNRLRNSPSTRRKVGV